MKYEKGDKFIIEIDRELSTDLYKIKGFNALVVNDNELDRLEQVHERGGCDGCEHVPVSTLNLYPCNECKQNYIDRWERKTEEIQVGDEVEFITGQRGVVTRIEKDEINTFYQVNKICFWVAENCFRTGKTYPELIKALAELPKEGE